MNADSPKSLRLGTVVALDRRMRGDLMRTSHMVVQGEMGKSKVFKATGPHAWSPENAALRINILLVFFHIFSCPLEKYRPVSKQKSRQTRTLFSLRHLNGPAPF